MAYATLGSIRFEGLKSFSELSETKSANYAQIPVIGGKPVLQRIGTDLAEITLGITFHRGFCDPDTEIAALESLRVSGEILPLTTGAGETLGNFVIRSISRDLVQTHTDGTTWEARLSLSLLETAQTIPAPTGFAISTISPREVPQLTPPVSSPTVKIVPVQNATIEAAETSRRMAVVTRIEAVAEDPAAAYVSARTSAVRLQSAISGMTAAGLNATVLASSAANLMDAIDAADATLALASLDDIVRRIGSDAQPQIVSELQNLANRRA